MFSNFVSLGAYCPVASSMSKFGLRSWSGPFDWLVTDSFKWVLYFIDNDFKDFMLKEDLEIWEGDPKQFRNKRSGFLFLHERKFFFEEQFVEIKQKYTKRIERFLVETLKPTCYLRWVTNTDEIEYIAENYKYINDIVKKKNCRSEIVFVIRKDLEMTRTIFSKYFIMTDLRYGTTREILRGLFDGANDFLSWCASNYDINNMMSNLQFDRKQEDHVNEVRANLLEKYKIYEQRYILLKNLLEDRIKLELLPSRIIIYGAGNVGKLFYYKIVGQCDVVSFVDREKAGQKIDGIFINKLEDVICAEDITYIITATYDFQNICNDIYKEAERQNCKEPDIVSLDCLFIK